MVSANKFALSLAVAGLLTASSALAESEGWFAGVYLGQRSLNVQIEGNYIVASSGSASGMKFGVLGGRQQNLADAVGLRYYAAADIGDDTTNINANVDALYTFTKSDGFEFRGFAGVWAGYASHISTSGFDLGLNAGLRGIIAQKHGVELYGHFGFLSQDETVATILGTSYKVKYSQPYQIGLRYTYSF